MAKHLYLPKIQPSANIDKPSVNALWEDKQKKIIQAISDGIEIDEMAQSKGVSSIPDIYARPLIFLSAFRSDKHPLKKRIIQEWRGLLSLLALHKVKPDLANLTISPVEIGDDKFSTALKNLCPKPIILQKNGTEYSWTDILLIRFNDIPIGAFSPATLVFTASDYSRRLKEKSFALKDDDGFLRPPTKAKDLEFVGEWLEGFIKQFNEKAFTDSNSASTDFKYSGDINKQLQSWLSEIKKELGIEEAIEIDAEKVKMGEEQIPLTKSASFLSKYHIYQSLLKPLIIDEQIPPAESKSDYSLKTFRNFSGNNEIVIIYQTLLDKNNNIWDGTSPNEWGDINTIIERFFKVAKGTKLNTISLEDSKSIWIRPELYFLTDTLLRNKANSILNVNESYYNAENSKYILPFTEEILHYFSPEKIKSELKPYFEEKEGKVTFCFSLPLKNNTSVLIKKVFRSKGADKVALEGQILDIDVPVLEIFPNYLGDFWCQYFMLYSDTENYIFNPLNFNINSATIFTKRQEQKFETNTSTNKAEIVKISGYNSFPEAISMVPKQNSLKPYGLILLSKDINIENAAFNNGAYTIGIDFGTSNTNIYESSENGTKKWEFSFSKYIRSFLNSPEDKRKEITNLFFVPIDDEDCKLPTPSALRIFKSGIVDNVILDYFIYFPDKLSKSRYPNNVRTDIKWDADNTNLNLFLKSLVFLLFIDLIQKRVKRIEFRCSYPKSFSDNQIEIYKTIWKSTIEELLYKEVDEKIPKVDKLFYVKYNLDKGYYVIDTHNNGRFLIKEKPIFITEGICAGEYFSSPSLMGTTEIASIGSSAICIDVGGGTSDYSLWYKSKIKFDASVLLAGNQIMKFFKNNYRICDILFKKDSVDALNEVKDNERLFSSRLNYILRDEEKEIASKLAYNANNKDIAWLRRMLAIEFGALSIYAAHICLVINEILDFELAGKINENGIKLHWGGNAAKFISWIDFGKYDKEGISSTFLNGIFINSIMDKTLGERIIKPRDLGQVQSPNHKDEASGGIVVMNATDGNDGDQAEEIIDITEKYGGMMMDDENPDGNGSKDVDKDILVLGEEVTVNKKVYKHYESVDKTNFFSKNESLFDKTSLVQLERFIKLINFVGKNTGLFPEGSQINLSDAEKLAIKNNIINDISKLAQLSPGKRNVEPIFIMEVKYLLEILSKKMQ